MDRKRNWIVIATLLFVFFINFFIDHTIRSSGVALLLFGFLMYIVGIADRKTLPRKLIWAITGSTLFSIGAIVVNGSGFIQSVSVLFSLILLALLCYVTHVVRFPFRRISELMIILGNYLWDI